MALDLTANAAAARFSRRRRAALWPASLRASPRGRFPVAFVVEDRARRYPPVAARGLCVGNALPLQQCVQMGAGTLSRRAASWAVNSSSRTTTSGSWPPACRRSSSSAARSAFEETARCPTAALPAARLHEPRHRPGTVQLLGRRLEFLRRSRRNPAGSADTGGHGLSARARWTTVGGLSHPLMLAAIRKNRHELRARTAGCSVREQQGTLREPPDGYLADVHRRCGVRRDGYLAFVLAWSASWAMSSCPRSRQPLDRRRSGVGAATRAPTGC